MTQTTFHAIVNFLKCNKCSEVVTLVVVQITDDMKHDSFISRAAQNTTFEYLASKGIDLSTIIQFCDNCAAQYKSCHLFAELARLSLNVIRVFFGEKHGKSHADSLFGRLKSWMGYQIRTRHAVIRNTRNFFTYCRDHYATPQCEDICQHYRVVFQYLRPSDIRRKQDCDLDEAVDKTMKLYSVRNMKDPLTLKARNVPCLCPPCVTEDGLCLNRNFADPWLLIHLRPKKGDNPRNM